MFYRDTDHLWYKFSTIRLEDKFLANLRRQIVNKNFVVPMGRTNEHLHDTGNGSNPPNSLFLPRRSSRTMNPCRQEMGTANPEDHLPSTSTSHPFHESDTTGHVFDTFLVRYRHSTFSERQV
ncbi:uncharacterized protein LOC123317415 [Coccinella septempunctata]|uniref:uncharacterized protein LOC123317415 n=1 Tax=Coccinella septempunctata TaxID=41139 RepID=UPI001D099B29|nr:uncharacterized protein LOC123317415 [Coccinella septempunctata]